MRYDPCGLTVDVGRKPYSAQCRFFRDDDFVGQITWFEVDEDTPDINMDCTIGRYYNGPHLELQPPVGEIIDSPRVFDSTADGVHTDRTIPCGTPTDFLRGGLYRPDLPPRKLSSFLVPCCCLPKPLIPSLNTPTPFMAPFTYAIAPERAACQWPLCTPDMVRGMWVTIVFIGLPPVMSNVEFDWWLGSTLGGAEIASGHFSGPATHVSNVPFLGGITAAVYIPLNLLILEQPVYVTVGNAPPHNAGRVAFGELVTTPLNWIAADGVHFFPYFGQMAFPDYS